MSNIHLKPNINAKYICKIYIATIKYIHVNNYYKLGSPPNQEVSISPPLELETSVLLPNNNVECTISYISPLKTLSHDVTIKSIALIVIAVGVAVVWLVSRGDGG
jgi:hypothetical protein